MSRRFRSLALLPTVLLLLVMAPAPPAAAAGGVFPLLDCVTWSAADDEVTATFGYASTNASALPVPYGPDNYFTPAPFFRGQPDSFEPGIHHEVFTVSFPASDSLTWTLLGTSVVASNDPDLYCPGSGGPVTADSSLAMPASVATTTGVDVPVSATVTDPLAPATGTSEYGTVVYALSGGLAAGALPTGSPCVVESAALVACQVSPGADNQITVGSTAPGSYRVTGTFVPGLEGDPAATNNVATTTVLVTGTPAAVTGPAGAATATGTVLTGTVDPAGAATSWSFSYWPDGHPDQAVTTTSGDARDGFVPVPVDAALTGLKPATTYAYALTATNTNGTDTGDEGTFTTSAPAAGLSVTASASPSATTLGSAVTQTFTVLNGGPSDATGVRLSVQLADGAPVVSATPAAGSCTTSGTPAVVTCDLGTIGDGDSVVVTVVSTADRAGTLVTTGFVAGAEADPSVADNLATTTVPVAAAAAQAADLSVGITAYLAAKVTAPITFTVTVRNSGPDAATDAQLLLSPTFASVTSASPAQGSCTLGATPACRLGDIPAGGSVRIVVRVLAKAVGPITLTATVSSSTPDPVAANDTVTRVVVAKR